jgi:polynucleotide 5'-kinase involved in rRNA processing
VAACRVLQGVGRGEVGLCHDHNHPFIVGLIVPSPIRVAFGGGLSPGNSPSLYVAAIKRVFSAYLDHPLVRNAEDVAPPLIVNTMGWNKGTVG